LDCGFTVAALLKRVVFIWFFGVILALCRTVGGFFIAEKYICGLVLRLSKKALSLSR